MIRPIAIASCGAAALLLLLELMLRALPVSTASLTGYYLSPDLLGYPPGHQWTVSTGWDLRDPQRLRANAQGFVADRDFAPNADAVALIGDSYVEASMLDAADRPAAQLERLLGGRPVYAMGTPGTALLDYGLRVRWAVQSQGIRQIVLLLERGDIMQSLCGSGNVVSQCLDPDSLKPRIERHPPPSAVKRWVRHSALAQYLVGHLRLDVGAFLRSAFTRQVPGEGAEASTVVPPSESGGLDPAAVQLARSRIDAVLDAFFAELAPLGNGLELLVLLDGARSAPWLAGSEGRFERDYLMEQLRARNVRVVDLQSIYRMHAETDPRSLEIGPHDQHLNALGVFLAMQAAAGALRP